jgi:SAM-dependent methyltransferase
MTGERYDDADRYAGTGRRWATGAALVYGPIATDLVAMSPRTLAGCTVLDAGAGTGSVSAALAAAGARVVALDRSMDMLAWDAQSRPPCAVADVRALPLPDSGVDASVAAFVLNHLVRPSEADAMRAAADASGLADVVVEERPVDVGVTTPEQLVRYRLGQSLFTSWLDSIAPARPRVSPERRMTLSAR